jgi:hypothetical protein
MVHTTSARIDSALMHAIASVVVLHALISLAHGLAHLLIPVPVTLLELIYIVVVIAIMPVIGAALIYTPRRQFGAWLVFVGMGGAFLFGLAQHFLLPGGDNVANMPPTAWTGVFQVSAALLGITEVVGTLLAAAALRAVGLPGKEKRI